MKELRDLRRSLKLTQEDLAKSLGLTRSTVNRLEQGKHKPQEKHRLMIEVWMEIHGKRANAE